MTRVALLTDTHLGTRNNSLTFLNWQLKFYEECFFPYCAANGIKHLLHLGDAFDRRSETNHLIFEQWDRRMFSMWSEMFEQVHFVIGNHDTYYKNTNRINAPERFLSHYSNFRFYSGPVEMNLLGARTLIIPWVCEENEKDVLWMLDSSMSDLVVGHLEIVGGQMSRSAENLNAGFQPSVFSKFKQVLSGHYHLRSTKGNINYLGSPTASRWDEAPDSRGFHILDTDSLQLEFVENVYNPFVRIVYRDTGIGSIPEVQDRVVRLVVEEKSSETEYLKFLEAIQEQRPASFEAQEQPSELERVEGVDESLDLFSLMDLYVDRGQFDGSKPELKGLLRDLYQEALSLHDMKE
jgi:DNA repair exonuclease SbcCD nuclease subunit